MHEIAASPKLIRRGCKSNIDLTNRFYDSLVRADVRAGYKATIVKTNAIMGNNDMSLYRADSIHPNTAGYEKMQLVIVSSVQNSKGTVPPVTSKRPTANKIPVARAGAD